MDAMIDNRYGPNDERRTATYRKWRNAYRNATDLHAYIYGRWIDDPNLWRVIHVPTMDGKYGVQVRSV